MKLLIFISLLSIVLILPSMASAIETSTSSSVRYTNKQIEQLNRKEKEASKTSELERIKQLKIKTAAIVAQERLQQLKSKSASQSSDRQGDRAIKRQELEQKLKTIKDKQKVSLLERVNQNLATVNTNVTQGLSTFIEKMEQMVGRLETQINELKAQGKDTTEAEQSLAAAKLSINGAKQQVASQSVNDYTLTISAESALKQDVQGVRDSLFTDLKQTRQMVIDARQSLSQVITNLKTLGGTSGQ